MGELDADGIGEKAVGGVLAGEGSAGAGHEDEVEALGAGVIIIVAVRDVGRRIVEVFVGEGGVGRSVGTGVGGAVLGNVTVVTEDITVCAFR